jgi:anti-sigma factor RsiW
MSELDLACDTVSELATGYLEHELSESRRTAYETHLVVCDNCVAYLADMRAIAVALRALPVDGIDEDERSRILAEAGSG